MSTRKWISQMALVALTMMATSGSAVAQATQVRVETAANGSGFVVQSQFLGTGRTLTVYAISRTAGGAFVSNVTSTWLLENKTGGVVDGDLVPAGDGKSAVLTGNALGSATIRATSGGLAQTPSGTITVVTPVPVFISPATKNILPTGGPFTVTVEITNAVNVHAFHVVFSLNNAYIRYAGRLEGTFLNQSGLYSTLFLSSPAPAPSVTSVTVDNAILGPEGVDGDGTLFSITFAPVANGTSAISLDAVDLRDAGNNAYPSILTSGSVFVNNPSTVWVDPTYNSGNQGGHEFGYDGHSTLANGLTAVSVGGTMNVAPATYGVTFNVTKNVTLTPSGGIPTIQSLTVNTPTVFLGGDFQISNTLTLTSGLLTLGASNLGLGATAAVAGTPSATAMVVATGSGQLRKTLTGIGSFTFPVGDNTGTPEYSPVTLNFTSGLFSSAYAGVRVVNAKHPENTGTVDYLSRYWTVMQSGISGFACDASFKYVPADIVGSEAGLVLGQWDGAQWAIVGGVIPTNTLFGSGLTSFSDFTGGAESALPIQLASFNGNVLNNGDVRLTWVTLSEVNNYGFYVQRRRLNEQNYFEIPNSFVAGHGTTNEPHTYTFVDAAPGAGLWQYRLKQVDLNGVIHYTEPIQIDVLTAVDNGSQPTAYSLKQNYPNPFNPTTTIEFVLPAAGYTTLKVFNLLGEEVGSLVDGLVTAGLHTAQWNAAAIPSGIYLYKLSSKGYVETRKLILMK